MDLPVYKMILSEDPQDTGVEYMAIVNKPAIGVNFEKFSEATRFKVQDEERRIISGPIMIPDMLIYRFDKERGEYYLQADKDTIEKTALRFAKRGNFANVNIEHNENDKVSDVYMFESFIINKEKGIAPVNFSDLPDGTWFGSYKVDNEKVWEDYISSGQLKGFSIDGAFVYEKKEETRFSIIDALDELLSKIS